MKKLLVILVILVSCFNFSCSTVTTKLDNFKSEDLINYVDKTITGAEWIKGVTDLVITTACMTGKINAQYCSNYSDISNVAQITINNAKQSVLNYKSTGDLLSKNQMMSALEDIMKVVFKLDTIYKTPVENLNNTKL